MVLPAFAAERRVAAPLLLGARRPPLSIDTSCPHGAQQQTHRTPLMRSNDGTDRRTDGRTPDRYTDRAPHTVWSMPIGDHGTTVRCLLPSESSRLDADEDV